MSDIAIEWTPDCQGKWDYDGRIVSVSSRYWPRGGGFSMLDRQAGTFETNADQSIRPSAHSTIYLGEEELVGREFEGATEDEVKRAVEAWVAEQIGLVSAALRAAFAKEAP